MADAVTQLLARLQELQHLQGIAAVLSWDQEVTMPPGGIRNRAAQRSTLAALVHERLTAPDLGALLADLADAERLAPAERANVRLVTRQRERAVRLPERLVREQAEAVGLAQPEWVAARREDDWARFAPHLERIVRLKREEATALGIGDEPYDALLDEHEPDARTAQIVPVFAALRASLTRLLAGIDVDAVAALPGGPYPLDAQAALSREVIDAMGYDLTCGRLDVSAHPFSETLGHGDVRITTHYHEDDLLSGLTSTMHEAGHALYEQGLPAALAATPAGQAVSVGIHESQSRLWENQVGRGLPFCRWLAPRLRRHFPGPLAGLDPDALHAAANRVRPSLIRIDADEVTYNSHIILRMEIERGLIDGRLAVADIPAAWREQVGTSWASRCRTTGAGPAGHPLVRRRPRLLPDLHPGQPLRRHVLERGARRPARPGRAARRRRVRPCAGGCARTSTSAPASNRPTRSAAGSPATTSAPTTSSPTSTRSSAPDPSANTRTDPWPSARPPRRPPGPRASRSPPPERRPSNRSSSAPRAREPRPTRRSRWRRPSRRPPRPGAPPRPRRARRSGRWPARSAARPASSTRPSWWARSRS
ncbi:MAG: carboxypeptidase M32 [Candidatus Krumholzibacteriia bacterium]